MSVAEVIYRLVEFVQMTIQVRSNVDSFNIYHATSIGGPYTKFLEVPNVEHPENRFKGRTVFQFNPADLLWDNTQINYIKIAPVTNLVEGAQEGPVKVYPLHYDQSQATNNKTALFVYDETEAKWVPANTSMSAFQ